MTTTRADAVLTGLVAQLQAYAGLGPPGSSGVVVYDGPVPAVDATPVQEYVSIGWDGDLDSGSDVAVDITQDWHDMGPGANRDEWGDVTCSVWCAPTSTDDTDMAGLRTRAVTIVGLVESAIRAAPDLGVTGMIECAMTVGQLRQAQTVHVALVAVPFTVRYHALI